MSYVNSQGGPKAEKEEEKMVGKVEDKVKNSL